ncbi:MAG TPA: SHOCT domain-containing protein, partial [Thermoanaerobaculia bacterium]|nr:SHOCT domain-containing protein [Thermoanaerobaculia bacterium]
PGDYHEILGSPFSVAAAGRKTRRFHLSSGEVSGLELKVDKKRVRLGGKRRLLRMEEPTSGWRVLAYTKPGEEPRIVEHSRPEGEGFAVIWLDRPSLFVSGFLHRRLPAVEENRAKVEKYLFDRTRTLSTRRYGVEQTRQAAQPSPPKGMADRLKNLDELLKQGFITREEFEEKRAKLLASL